MASSKTPKFIPISRGDHEISPHLASLRASEIDDVLDISQHTAPYIPKQPAPPTAVTVRVNLLDGLASEKPKKTEPEVRAQLTPSFAPLAPTEITVQKPVEKAKEKKRAAQPQERTSFKPLRHASVAFVLVAFVLVTPLKALTTFERLREAKNSVESLGGARELSNYDQASIIIGDALRSFHAANNSLSKIDRAEDFILQNVPIFGEKFGVATRLVSAGEHVSLAAASYMQLFRNLQERADAPLIERLNLFFDGNRAVVADLQKAANLVRPIDPTTLPESQQKFVAAAKDAILALTNDAEYLASAGPVILSTLGTTTPRRYLIVFQNPTELRPTGGFIGSFALLDIKNGEITQLQVPPGGSYDLQGTLKKQVYAPLPLHIINPRWEFQDGNWFPDFPTSAQKLMWFLEKSQGPSVDGVIAVNATLLPALLEVVGPVHVAGAEKTLSADTALATLRESITARAQESKPKTIITNAAPALIETIKAGKTEHFLPVITTLLKGLETRDIQLYTKDVSSQEQIAAFGWDGALRTNPTGDYLNVIGTNIGGQKTDAVITQDIDHQARINADGTIEVSVRVQRTQKKSVRALEDTPNISYLRYYVPRGATLISAHGFTFPHESLFHGTEKWEKPDADLQTIEHEIGVDALSGTRITEEFNHTVFGNWMITQPGGTTESLITYTLPFQMTAQTPSTLGKISQYFNDEKNVASYSAYIQRQSGMQNTHVSSRVILPDGWRVGWTTDARAQLGENGILVSVPFENDLSYAVTAYAKTNSQTQKNQP